MIKHQYVFEITPLIKYSNLIFKYSNENSLIDKESYNVPFSDNKCFGFMRISLLAIFTLAIVLLLAS